MGSSRRDGSQRLLAGTSPIHSKKVNNSPHGNDSRSTSKRVFEVGAAISPNPEEDVNGFDIKSWSDGGDCLRLFPGTGFFSIASDYQFLTELSTWWISMASSINEISRFDGSRINPIEEASVVLKRTPNSVVFQEHLEQVVAWLLHSKWNGFDGASLTYTDCTESSTEQALFEDSSDCNNSLTPLSTDDASSSWIWDIDKLEDRDSLLDKEMGWDVFPSDFPSPLYKNRCDLSAGSSVSNASTFTEEDYNSSSYDLLSENGSEADKIEDLDSDGPLFCPSESKFNWNPEELFDYFSISPRRVENENTISERFCSPKTVILRLHSRKYKDRKDKFFSSKSKVPATFNLKTKVEKRNISGTRPSKLSKSCKDSMENRAIEIKDSLEEPTTVGLVTDYRDLLEECFLSNDDAAIETLVGLNEFDGHEGVNEEFKEEDFSLDVPLDD